MDKIPIPRIPQQLYTLPFNFSPVSSLKSSYTVTIDPSEVIQSCRFIEGIIPFTRNTSRQPDQISSFCGPATAPNTVLIRTDRNIYIIDNIKCYLYRCDADYHDIWVNIQTDNQSIASSALYRVFGITLGVGCCALEEILADGVTKEVITFDGVTISCHNVSDSVACYLGVIKEDKSSFVHIIRCDVTETAEISSSINCNGVAISSLYPCNSSHMLIGCSHNNVYIWSCDSTECLCDLHLPGYPDPLLVHSALWHNSNLLISVQTGVSVFSLVLDGVAFTQQKLLSEITIPRDTHVFGCGLYLAVAAPHNSTLEFYNTAVDVVSCHVTLPVHSHMIGVQRDVPVVLLRTNDNRIVVALVEPDTAAQEFSTSSNR